MNQTLVPATVLFLLHQLGTTCCNVSDIFPRHILQTNLSGKCRESKKGTSMEKF